MECVSAIINTMVQGLL